MTESVLLFLCLVALVAAGSLMAAMVETAVLAAVFIRACCNRREAARQAASRSRPPPASAPGQGLHLLARDLDSCLRAIDKHAGDAPGRRDDAWARHRDDLLARRQRRERAHKMGRV